jgi:phage-related protein
MADQNILVQVGANITGLTRGLNRATSQITGMGQTVRSLTSNMSGLSERAQGMARDLREAFRTPRTTMNEHRESLIEVQHGYLELARNSEEYAGRTGDLMSALEELGNTQRQVSQSMISDNIAVRTSFLSSIGAMLGASTQSSSIASNLARINNPLYNVNRGLLNVSDGMERMARNGAPAILALRQLGPTASMAQLQSQIRLINAGIMRMGAVALVAAGASILLYGALHKAAKAMNPEYGIAFANMLDKLKQAFQPMVDVFAAVMTPLYNFVAMIAEMVIKFNEAHPTIAKMIAGFFMLLPILTLILAPLAVGIGLYGGLAAAMNAVWVIIGPMVTGFATMMGTVMLVAAVVVGLVAAFIYAYNNIEWFRNGVDAAWEWIKNTFNTALEFIKGIVQSVMSAVASFIGGVLGDIKAFWDENGSAIMTIVKTYFTLISAYISVIMATIKAVFQVAWAVIVGAIKVAWALIQSVISTAINLVLGIISVAMKVLQGDWKGAWETIKGTAKTIMDNIVGFFKGIDLAQIGKNIIQGLVNGIGGMIGTVKKKVQEIAALIPKGVKDFLGIHSPSRVMMELGVNTGEGFQLGLKDQLAKIKAAALDMASAALPEAPQLSLAYETPSRAGIAAGVQANYDVNTKNSGLESLLQKLDRKLDNIMSLTVEMDGHEVGRAVEPHIDSLQADKFNLRSRMGGMKR